MSSNSPLKSYVQKLLRDLPLLFLGILIASYGSRMAFSSGVGVAPIYMVDEGLCKRLHVSLGTAILIVGAATLLVGALLNRRSIGAATVITSLTTGFFVDLLTPLLPPLPGSYPGRLLYLLAGLAVNCFGIALYLRLGHGGSSLEIIMLCISQRLGVSIAAARFLSDALWFLLGWLLGGTWGLGTLIALLLCGPMLQGFSRLLEARSRT